MDVEESWALIQKECLQATVTIIKETNKKKLHFMSTDIKKLISKREPYYNNLQNNLKVKLAMIDTIGYETKLTETSEEKRTGHKP